MSNGYCDCLVFFFGEFFCWHGPLHEGKLLLGLEVGAYRSGVHKELVHVPEDGIVTVFAAAERYEWPQRLLRGVGT